MFRQGVLTFLIAWGVVFAAQAMNAAPPTPGTVVPMPDSNTQTLRALLWTPDDRMDLAKAKVTIDHLVDPSVDVAATLHQVDAWAAKVRARLPAGATTWTKVLLLANTIYQPGPWNDFQKFDYNFDDPFGKDVHTTMLSNYLETKHGNCVSMPIFFAILAQRIGLHVALAVAPNHMLVKIKLDDGQWKNIEATSGTTLTDLEYMERFQIAPRAIESGLYLRPLSPHEAVVEMATPYMQFYEQSHSPAQTLAMVDLALRYDSKDVGAWMIKALAYDKQVTVLYRSKYPDTRMLSPWQFADYKALMDNYFNIADQLQAMGWHRRSEQQDQDYMQAIEHAKSQEKGS